MTDHFSLDAEKGEDGLYRLTARRVKGGHRIVSATDSVFARVIRFNGKRVGTDEVDIDCDDYVIDTDVPDGPVFNFIVYISSHKHGD